MTRRNLVPSYNPELASFSKLATVFGASFSYSSAFMVPLLVSMVAILVISRIGIIGRRKLIGFGFGGRSARRRRSLRRGCPCDWFGCRRRAEPLRPFRTRLRQRSPDSGSIEVSSVNRRPRLLSPGVIESPCINSIEAELVE